MITGNQQDSLFIKMNKNPYGWSGLPDSEHGRDPVLSDKSGLNDRDKLLPVKLSLIPR